MKKLTININSQVVEHERVVITSLPLSCMQLGLGIINSSRKKVRCVRWRDKGICRYVLIGSQRGKILPVIREFRKIRQITEKEKKKMMNYIEQRKNLL